MGVGNLSLTPGQQLPEQPEPGSAEDHIIQPGTEEPGISEAPEERTFTQADVDRIVQKRLADERQSVQSRYGDLKQLVSDAKKAGDNAQLVSQLESKLAAYENQSMQIEIAAEIGLPVSVYASIQGNSPAEMRESAKRILSSLKEHFGPVPPDINARSGLTQMQTQGQRSLLTPEEKAVAKKFGMSEAEFLKAKNSMP
jgi:phage I-like protein